MQKLSSQIFPPIQTRIKSIWVENLLKMKGELIAPSPDSMWIKRSSFGILLSFKCSEEKRQNTKNVWIISFESHEKLTLNELKFVNSEFQDSDSSSTLSIFSHRSLSSFQSCCENFSSPCCLVDSKPVSRYSQFFACNKVMIVDDLRSLKGGNDHTRLH